MKYLVAIAESKVTREGSLAQPRVVYCHDVYQTSYYQWPLTPRLINLDWSFCFSILTMPLISFSSDFYTNTRWHGQMVSISKPGGLSATQSKVNKTTTPSFSKLFSHFTLACYRVRVLSQALVCASKRWTFFTHQRCFAYWIRSGSFPEFWSPKAPCTDLSIQQVSA